MSIYGTDVFDSIVIKQPESHKTALQIIQESLPQEAAAKFHSNSREPFDYEQPVIDAAKDAMKGRSFYKHSDKPARLLVPFWLYENCSNIVQRTHEVEVFIDGLQFVKRPLRVSVTREFFENIIEDEYVKVTYKFYTDTPVGISIQDTEDGLVKTRWFKLLNTLFVEEPA